MENRLANSWLWVVGSKILIVLLLTTLYLLPTAQAQFTTGKDTLVILSGDSTTHYYDSYRSVADTSGGQPYVGKTAGYDLDGKILVGVDFDTTSAWTATKFIIQTSATYNDNADTSGGTPYDWKTVNYGDSVYTFNAKTKAITVLNPLLMPALKRYIRFGCYDTTTWKKEAARRKLIPLIRQGF